MAQFPDLPIRIRFATDQDIGFIFSSWLKSFRDSGLLSHGVVNTIFYPNHHVILEKILKRATTYIACDVNDPTQILGYMVAEYIDNIFILHYIYVKHNFRKLGIGRKLLNSMPHNAEVSGCCTHMTRLGKMLNMKFNFVYHPYIVLLNYEVPEESEK